MNNKFDAAEQLEKLLSEEISKSIDMQIMRKILMTYGRVPKLKKLLSNIKSSE